MGEDVDLNRLAAETCSFSGASLEALLNEAAILAAERNAERIGQQDIDRAFYRTVAGEDAPRSVEPEEKLAIAAHEAGHAVAAEGADAGKQAEAGEHFPVDFPGMAGYNLSSTEGAHGADPEGNGGAGRRFCWRGGRRKCCWGVKKP